MKHTNQASKVIFLSKATSSLIGLPHKTLITESNYNVNEKKQNGYT